MDTLVSSEQILGSEISNFLGMSENDGQDSIGLNTTLSGVMSTLAEIVLISLFIDLL